MPARPPAPNVIHVQTLWTYGGDTSLGTSVFLHYTGAAPNNTSMQAFATVALNSAATHFVPLLDVNAAVVGVTATDLTSPAAGVGVATGTHAGTRLGNPLPAQSCALQNCTIQRRYRGGKPRRYWPFGTSSDLASPQTWTPAFITAVNTALSGWFTDLFNSPPSPTTLDAQVNVSYYQGYLPATITPSGRAKNHPAPRATPVVDTIVGTSINVKVGSQRRRIAA